MIVGKRDLFKVKNLEAFAPNIKVDWQQMAKDQLLNSYNVTEDYAFFPTVKFLNAVESLSRKLEKFDKGLVGP